MAAVQADASSRILRHWVDWNYSGLEAKELWPAWQELTQSLRGDAGAGRVAVEYGALHERAGSIRMHETLPFFSGRSGIEGVYNQSSTTTHPVYYLISELFPSSPNPFRSRTYSRFDPDSALSRLSLFNVSHVVAVSDRLAATLDARSGVVREASFPPYTVYRVADPTAGYVAPLAFAPVRSPREGWRDQSFRWFSRKPPNRAVLVFTDDRRFDVVAADGWAPPPERPLPPGSRGHREGRGRVDSHHDDPARPPSPRQDLLSPALAGGGRLRALSRLARAHADRAAPARRAPLLRRAHRVGLARPGPGGGGARERRGLPCPSPDSSWPAPNRPGWRAGVGRSRGCLSW